MTARMLALWLTLTAIVGMEQSRGDDWVSADDTSTVPGRFRDNEAVTEIMDGAGVPITEEVPATTDESLPAEVMPEELGPEYYEPSASEIVAQPMTPEEAFGVGQCLVDDFNIDYPLWYVRGENIWLSRTTYAELTTATIRYADGSLGNNRLSDQGFGIAPGMRVSVGRNVWDGLTYIEASYFGLNHWDDNRYLGRNGNVGIIASNLDMGFGTSTVPNSQVIKYSSTLHNAEVNLRSYFSPNVVFIGGIRYLHLSESLGINEKGTVNATSGGTTLPFDYTATRTITVGNNLLGPQIGTDLFWDLTDDIRVGGLGRLVLSANFSDTTARQSRDGLSTINGSVIRNSRVQYDFETAWSGILELGAVVDCRLTPNVVLRGGYQFMWLYNVALSTNQHVNDITDPNGPQRQIENGSQAIFFGPFAGLEVSWGRFE